MAAPLKVKRGEVLSGLTAGKVHRIVVSGGAKGRIGYEVHLKATNAAAYRKVDKGTAFYLGHADKAASAKEPGALAWKNTKGWALDLYGVEKVEEDGKVDKHEVADGLRLSRIPGRANLRVTDLATNEVLVEGRDFEDHVELFFDDSVKKIRVEAELPSGKKKWAGELELPTSEKQWSREAYLALKKA